MSEALLTVEQAAARLKLHVKTVLRYVREGRLKAQRVGKAYRIARSDLDAFAGADTAPVLDVSLTATTIVDLADVDAEQAQRWARAVTAALNAPGDRAPMRADTVYDPLRQTLKIVILGQPGDTGRLLGLIQIWSDQWS